MVTRESPPHLTDGGTPLAGAMQELSQLLLEANSFHELMVKLAELAVRTIRR